MIGGRTKERISINPLDSVVLLRSKNKQEHKNTDCSFPQHVVVAVASAFVIRHDLSILAK